MAKLLLLGAGGHCKSILGVLSRTKAYDEISIVAPDGQTVGNIKNVGNDNDIARLRAEFNHAFVSVGTVGDMSTRRKLYQLLRENDYTLPNIISPAAEIADTVSYREGNFVSSNVSIEPEVKLGKMNIINTGAVICHDTEIGDFVHVAPNATICGNVHIGDNVMIGAGSTVIQGIKIGNNAIIGAGAVVIRDVKDNAVVVGNPAKKIKENL